MLSLNLRDKTEDIGGLQLADLVVTPVVRFVLGKTIKEDFEIVKSKFRRNREGKSTTLEIPLPLPQKPASFCDHHDQKQYL